jgi:hypothetical protein
VPVVLGLSAIGGNGSTPPSGGATPAPATPAALAALGLDQDKLDNTWDTYRRLASFQWVTTDLENSAFVSMTREYLFEHNYFTVRKTLHSLLQYYRVRNF